MGLRVGNDSRVKRVFDLALSVPGLLVITPVLLLTAVAVRLRMGSPILFRQCRPGLHGRPFTLLKFRTMTDAAEEQARALPDEERLTPLGRLLRRTSLDELPEVINVVRGDMSLVGPRPLLMKYLDRYTREQMRRHEVRPGITGWAQVNGRNALTWEEKFELDLWYVDNQSLWLDMKILWMTVAQVIGGRGVSARGHATMPEFTGGLVSTWSERS
jgi:sugar transferase EpsL